MIRLILIRHAKSDWSAGEADHDRPLNARGERGADMIGAWLKAQGHLPDRILLSDATRTRQTADRIAAALGTAPALVPMRSLYHAASETMLAVLQSVTDGTVALVGHNPGIAMLAESLTRRPPDHPRFTDYPTAATTVLEFPTAIRPGDGQVIAFVTPQDL